MLETSTVLMVVSFSIAVSTPIQGQVETFMEHFTEVSLELVPRLMDSYGVPGVSVGLIDRDSVVFQDFGVARAGSSIKPTPDTRYLVGSVSKLVTAWGVVSLVEDGLLTLESPVFDFITRWSPPRSRFDPSEVTVRRLLSHTSGITGDGMNDWPPGRALPAIEAEFDGMGGARPIRLTKRPGTIWQYSNGGYALLQVMMEEITGADFAGYMSEKILQPLGMTSSVFSSGRPDGAAFGHHPSNTPHSTPLLGATGAGALWTTSRDLSAFMAAVVEGPNRGGGILEPVSIADMVSAAPATGNSWGMGFSIVSLQGQSRVVGHSGGRTGWVSTTWIDPRLGNGFVILTNSTAGEGLTIDYENAWFNEYRGWLTGGR